MKIRAILFDLDGTLIDQFEAIYKAFSETLLIMGFPSPSYEEVKRAVGGASDSTMQKLIGKERAEEAVQILRPIFEKEMLNGLKILPGVLEGLASLCQKGIVCAVLTNKHGPHARTTCEHLGIDQFLKFTIGANDTKWKKPNHHLTNYALSQIGFNSDQTVYVGDSPYDYETARNAGLKSYLVSTGTHKHEELSVLQDASVFHTFTALMDDLLVKIES